MEIYDPTSDILSFRDFSPPWLYVICPERLFQNTRVQPIAFNQSESLVLLHILEDPAPWMILSVFQCDSVEGPYRKLEAEYENIWHFAHSNR